MAVLPKCAISLVLVAFIACRLSAQEHSYVHYDVHDGLAGSTVYSMAQDNQGFMWFGTETGLSRWDGTHFQTFTTRDGLPDNEIFKIFVDSKNRVWVIPFNNTIAYYWKGVFHTHANDSVLRKISDTAMIGSICEDAKGNILVLRPARIELIDSSGKITSIKHTSSPMWDLKAGINRRGNFVIFHTIMHGYGLDEIKGDTAISSWSKLSNQLNSPAHIYLGADLQIWQDSDSTLFYDQIRETRFRLPSPKGLISVSRISPDAAMLNTYTSTYLVNIPGKKIVDSFLEGEPVNDVVLDSESNIWFCTLGRGVYRMGSPFVKNYFFRSGRDNIPVYSIQRFHDYLYIGADRHELYRLDTRTRRLEGPRTYGGNITRGRIMQMLVVDSRTMFLGTDMGILSLNKSIPVDGVESIKSLQLTRDSLLLSSSHLQIIERRPKDLRPVDTLLNGRSTCCFKSRDGTYYIGTLKGLYSLKKNELPVFLGATRPLLASRINALGETPDGLLWIATNGNGLVGYRDGKIRCNISEADGLTSDICRALFIKDGNIWIGTNKGLNKIIPVGDTWKIVPYTIADGLASDIVNTVFVEGNDVYVGTPEGITYFDERTISKTSICRLQITDMTVSNHRWPSDTTGFLLSHKNNNISLSYVGISFKSAGNIIYSYRLLGLDPNWKSTRETFISYPSLPSGNYELQLTATNKFGVKSEMASVKFSVEKLLWEKAWFWAVMLVMAAFCLYLLFRYRLRLVQKKEAERADIATRMAELEQMALRSQMNPHFIFNCLNSIQQYVIYQDVPGANEFISNFSHLIRTTLKISACEFISLEEELDYLRTYISLEKRRFDNKFDYDIVVGPDVDVLDCHIPPMILQPFIENSIRHGIGLRKDSNGKLEVRMEYRKGCLACAVIDNGVGRKVAAQFKSRNAVSYQSVGMSLVDRRIEMYNRANKEPVQIHVEDLVDEQGKGSGTKVTLLFPLDTVLQ
jgi:ligand-binding sensor domain-containing protein